MAKPNNQYSHAYDCFQRNEKNGSYQCIETKNNGKVCGTRKRKYHVQGNQQLSPILCRSRYNYWYE